MALRTSGAFVVLLLIDTCPSMCYNVTVNDEVESPCRRTSDWGFVLYLTDGKRVPVGVFSCYAAGAAQANAAMRHYGDRADRWEGEPLYVPIEDEDE